jgi:CBS-domain-containing membrane protein
LIELNVRHVFNRQSDEEARRRRGERNVNTGSICTRDVVTCRPDTPALDAARLIRNHHVGDLVVVMESDGRRTPVGIVTDRDIIVSVVAKEVDPASLFVSEIMSSPAVTAFEWEDVWQVLRRMRLHGVRRMPVLSDADDLIGIVTFDDLIGAVSELLIELRHVSARQKFFEEKART